MKLHRALSIVFVCCLASPLFGQLQKGKAESVDMAAKVLVAAASLIEDAVKNEDLRGAAILVARRGTIVLREAYGYRDLKKKKPMRIDSLFRMASNTKPLIAASILALAEDGKLSIDDSVAKYIPAFDNEKSRTITIKQLMTHTSGLRIKSLVLKPLSKPSKQFPKAPNLQSEVARFGPIGPAVKPGTSYAYSNAGYNTLGAVIEVVSGEPLGEFLRKRFYRPLNMKDSCNHEDVADRKRMSTVFRKNKDGSWRVGWTPRSKATLPFERASGGMISTVDDYANFLQAYLNGGKFGNKRVLSSKSVSEAIKPHTKSVYSGKALRRREVFYGYGWSVSRSGVYSHSGSDGTYAWVDPRRKIIGIVLTQSPKCPNPRRQFRRVVEAACK